MWIHPKEAKERSLLVVNPPNVEPIDWECGGGFVTPGGRTVTCSGCITPHSDNLHFTVHYGQSTWVIRVEPGYEPHLDYNEGVWLVKKSGDEPVGT